MYVMELILILSDYRYVDYLYTPFISGASFAFVWSQQLAVKLVRASLIMYGNDTLCYTFIRAQDTLASTAMIALTVPSLPDEFLSKSILELESLFKYEVDFRIEMLMHVLI